MSRLTTDQQLKELLEGTKRIAIVGLSNKPDRDSYRVAEYLLNHGYEIVPVNPTIDEVLGQKSVASLEAIEGLVDIVDVFRRADQVLPVAEEAVKIGAKAIWFQLEVVNEEAAQFASEKGLQVVMDKCIKIEHKRLF